MKTSQKQTAIEICRRLAVKSHCEGDFDLADGFRGGKTLRQNNRQRLTAIKEDNSETTKYTT